MNNIHAEVDEIFRTGNKKAVVSLFLSMQGNHIRAVEAETRLTKAQAEVERKDKLIEQMRDALEELVELKERRHSLPVEIYQESREKAWNKCRAAIAAAKGEV